MPLNSIPEFDLGVLQEEPGFEYIPPQSEEVEHKPDRWIIMVSSRALGVVCTCGHEEWDGGKFVKGNPGEVISRLKMHAQGLR